MTAPPRSPLHTHVPRLSLIRYAPGRSETREPSSRRISRLISATLLLLASFGLLSIPMPASGAVAGSLSLAPGRSASASLGGSYADVSGAATFTVPGTSSRTTYLAVQFRAANAGSGYRARVRIMSDGSLYIGFARVSGEVETLLTSTALPLKVAAGQKLRVEGKVTGSSPVSLTARAWIEGSTTPGWQVSLSDTSASRITGAGAVRVWGYLSSAATGATNVAYSNAGASSTTSTSPAQPAPPSSGGKPSDATVGVPAGTSLKAHYGDINVTTAGTVLNGLDIHGFVNVRAANVRITNSIVRGGRHKGVSAGLIANYGYPGLVIENVDVRAEYPSVYFDGIKGSHFIARRVHVVGNVDSIKIHGDDVTVENSLLENTTYYASDPHQGGGPSHNDNIQIQYGKNLRITGNTIRGATNFAILGAASRGHVPNLYISGNWLDGGHCTLKLEILNGWSQTATVTNNKFGPNRKVKTCVFTAYPSVRLTHSGNVMEADGKPVTPLILVS